MTRVFLSLAAASCLITAAAAAPLPQIQDAPSTPATTPAPDTPAPAKPAAHAHHRRRLHHHYALRAPAPAPEAAETSARPPAADSNGYTPAPVVPQTPEVAHPEANLVPPQSPTVQHTQVDPQTMQLHYPYSGSGYTPGSSPQAMDDATTAKVPGVMVNIPVQPKPPQDLPPPSDHP